MEKRRTATSGQMFSYLFTAAVGDLVVPILTVFLPLLTLEVGGNFFEVGIVGGISYVTSSFLPYLMGRYSDKFRSKHALLAASFAITASTSLVYLLASNPIEVIVARAVEGVGWSMLWPTLQSAVTTATDDKGRSLSIYNSVWSGAYAVGPIAAGLFATIGSLRIVFVATSVLLALGLIVNLGFHNANRESKEASPIVDVIPDSNKSEIRVEPPEKGRADTSFYFFAILVSAFAVSILLTFFPAIVNLAGIPVFTISVITSGYGILRFLFYLMTTYKQFRNRLFSRKHVENFVLVLVIGVAISSACLIFFDRNPFLSFLAFGIIGAAYSIVSTIAQSKIIAEAEFPRTGEAAGVFEISIGIGTFLGPTIAGVLLQFGKISPFLTPSFGIGAFVIFSITKLTSRRN